MIYNIPKIARDVRIAIDENKTSNQLLTEDDIDTLSVEEIVRSKIVEAVRRVVSEAPVHLLDGGLHFGDSIFWKDKCCGWTRLPDNFMRLLIFKMNDWERPVYEAITADDPRYALQSSRYKGIRGTAQRPVVAIVTRTEGRVLEFYSCKSEEATVEQALYYPLPYRDHEDGVKIPERCYHAVVYEAASLTLLTLGQGDLSARMRELSKELILL